MCETEFTLIFQADGNFSATGYEETLAGNESITFEGDTYYIEYMDSLGTSDTSDDVLVREVYKRQ